MILLQALTTKDTLTVAIGVGTVFVGLICIVVICKILGFFCNLKANKNGQLNEPTSPTPVAAKNAVIENRGEVVAAISAAIAEDLGTDISGIKILSIKKV